MTHNLITWYKATILHCIKFEGIILKTLIKKCSRIKGFVERTLDSIKVIISPLSKLAQLLGEILIQPKYYRLVSWINLLQLSYLYETLVGSYNFLYIINPY